MTTKAQQQPTQTESVTASKPESEFAKLMQGPISDQARKIDDFASGAVAYLDGAGQTLLAAMARGKAARVLKERIASKDIWPSILSLRGLASGFATDERAAKGNRDAVAYSDIELQDAIVDALLDGAMLADCEINIISGRKYLGVAFYRRRLAAVAKDIVWAPGIPSVISSTKPGYQGKVDELNVWRVPAILKFTPSRDGMDGQPQTLDHSGSSPEHPAVAVQYRGYSDTIDGAIGKAERKLRKRAYEMCIGKFTEDEPADEMPDRPVKTPEPIRDIAAEFQAAAVARGATSTSALALRAGIGAITQETFDLLATGYCDSYLGIGNQAEAAIDAEPTARESAPTPPKVGPLADVPTVAQAAPPGKPPVATVLTWDTFVEAMLQLAGSLDLPEDMARSAYTRWTVSIRKKGLEKTIPAATLQACLDAATAGSFDWSTGSVIPQ